MRNKSVKYFEFGPVDQEEMLFKDISIFSSSDLSPKYFVQ